MMGIFKAIIGWLLYHGNSGYKSEHFYVIKKRLVLKYGKPDGFDMQYIHGKKCYSCAGEGVHRKFYHGRWHVEHCWNCTVGWFKVPYRLVLHRYKIGQYSFHIPGEHRNYTEEKPSHGDIVGYIEKEETEWCDFASNVLFLLFEKGYIKRWYKSAGMGWRMAWWQPRNYAYNLAHILKHGKQSIPVERLINYLHWSWFEQPIEMMQYQVKRKVYRLPWYNHIDNELPF